MAKHRPHLACVEIIGAPSPVGLEGAMTNGVLRPYFEKFQLPHWKMHSFKVRHKAARDGSVYLAAAAGQCGFGARHKAGEQ